METEVNLLDVLKKAVETEQEIYSKVSKVIKYDKEAKTVDVEPVDGTAPLLRVKLTAAAGSTNVVAIPVIDSMVVVSFFSEATAWVSLVSEVESVEIRGNELGGLIKVEELKKQLDIVTSRIDTIYKAIKDGVPIAQDGGVGYQNTMVAILAQQTETEDYSEIENEQVKHG